MTAVAEVVQEREGAAPAPRPSWRSRAVLAGLVAVVVLPIVVAGFAIARDPWWPMGDWATMAYRTSQVGTRNTPLVGAYTVKGWAHPGPLLFWLGALFGGVMELRMTLNDLKLRARALLRPNRVEQELEEELAFHIEREARKLIDEGMTPAEARERAQARFGSTALAADRSRRTRYRGHRQHHSRHSVCVARLRQGAARRIDHRRDGGHRTWRGGGAVHRSQYTHLPRRPGARHRRDVRG